MIFVERHYFSAANTPLGFYSCFDSVIDKYRANRVYYIKGGSGCGKSTFMKKIGAAFKDAEYFHCSSDVNSLDGVLIPSKKAAVFDGTAPHVQDPVLCGAADETVDFGAFLHKDMLIKARKEIFRLVTEKAIFFKNAYRYLAAASALAPVPSFEKDCTFARLLDDTKEKYGLHIIAGTAGKKRNLFAEGFTPQGKVNFYNELFTGKTVKVTGDTAACFLEELGNAFLLGGYDVDFLLSPLRPDCCDHLLVRDLSLVFSAAFSGDGTEEIILSPQSGCLDEPLYNSLIEKAIDSLRRAKELHGQVEEHYIPAIDFSKVDEKCAAILEEIQGY